MQYIPNKVNNFLKELVGRSDKTRRNYQSFAEVFFQYLKKPVENITIQDILKFLDYGVKTQKWKLSTMRQYAKLTVRFLGEFKDEEYMKKLKNQIRNLPRPQRYTSMLEGNYIRSEQIDQFIKAAPNKEYEIAYTLILKAGLRISEALNQQIQDIRFKDNRLTVRGKGRGTEHKIRSVKITKNTMQTLKNYIGKKRTGNIINIKTRTLQYKWKQTAKKIGIPYWKKLTPHDGRHSFGIDFLLKRKKQGYAAVVLLANQMGHTDINVTKIYLDISGAEIDEIFESGEGEKTITDENGKQINGETLKFIKQLMKKNKKKKVKKK